MPQWIRGSDGKWYQGEVKEGRIWTFRGNTGVAPFSVKKKTLASSATAEDIAYAFAPPAQYNLPGQAPAPSAAPTGVAAPSTYVPGSQSGIPPEALGLPFPAGVEADEFVEGSQSGVPPEAFGSPQYVPGSQSGIPPEALGLPFPAGVEADEFVEGSQ